MGDELIHRLMQRCRELDDERGATAVEYGLMLAFIAIVIVSSVTGLGAKVVAIFQNSDLVHALS